MKELFAEQVDAQDGKGSEQDRPEHQSGDGIAEERDGEGLEIDEKSFAAEVGRIEDVEISGLERVYGIDEISAILFPITISAPVSRILLIRWAISATSCWSSPSITMMPV